MDDDKHGWSSIGYDFIPILNNNKTDDKISRLLVKLICKPIKYLHSLRIQHRMYISSKKASFANSLALLILILLSGCNFPTASDQTSKYIQTSSDASLQQTLITFRVFVAQPLPAGDSVFISLLDEVTGLAFNPQKHVMQAEDALTYSVTLPFNIGAVVKYRFSREGATVVNEHLYNDKPVRYRLYHVEGPAIVEDIVSRWTDTDYIGLRGRVMGQIVDAASEKSIPNILVTAAGEQAFSLADGSFLLDGLPPGMHNLVFYSLDGSYTIYQQSAIVAGDSTTPVSVQLNPAKLVTVIFTVNVPSNTPDDLDIRLAGNLYQLGNTFADLIGGVSTLASRMPSLGKLPDGRYMVTLNLPAGTYLEYKYTLGDGLWSAELSSKGAIRLHQLIVPGVDSEQNDSIEAWQTSGTNPIRFEVKTPPDTPQNEQVSIQFNPGFGWLEPIPMRLTTNSQGEEVWNFYLTGPFNNLTSLHYRYCRQNQCGSADDLETSGNLSAGREVNPSSNPGVITDEISSWAWLSNPDEAANVSGNQVITRGADFVAGISLESNYHPSWGPLLPQTINEVQRLAVNWLIYNPTWTFTNNTPPIIEPLPSQDMLWPELINAISAAQRQNLTIGIFPVPHFPYDVGVWWQNASRDFSWWISFFERYSNFILHHASVASSTNASTLILGGDWLNPALPGGVLEDGSASNVPQDAEILWRELIKKVREHYSGTITWALSYPEGVENPPPFLDAVDQVYILWSAPIAEHPETSVSEMQAQTNTIFNRDILPFQQQMGKPVIIAISYPSIDGGAMGCIAISEGKCLDYNLLYPPNPDIPEYIVNLQDQANAYNAVLSAINENDWISGFVSMGYYPPAILQDKSISIHGKPASGVLWYWSQKFLGR